MSRNTKASQDFGERFERLFAELCGNRFLKGFVFHSPKFRNPTEQEAGDIVLWIRRFVVNFELITHNDTLSKSTKQFVKRIGHKRDQLIQDHEIFKDKRIEICFENELGQQVIFDKDDIGDFQYCGIALVDFKVPLKKLHFQTVKKTIDCDFPLAIMPLSGFIDLLTEVDTIPDLIYYLQDRSGFLRQIFEGFPNPFLDLNLLTEKKLISFYKINENKFDLDNWNKASFDKYPSQYRDEFKHKVELRNKESERSFAIDDIGDRIRKESPDGVTGKLHAWELAMLSRRQRATEIGQKIHDALSNLQTGRNEKRWFAYYNQATGCWLVFYFRFGIDSSAFQRESEQLTRYKLLIEMADRDFKYSVFSYCFRKSKIETGSSFDDIYLGIADADKTTAHLSADDIVEARRYFDGGTPHDIKEFPDS